MYSSFSLTISTVDLFLRRVSVMALQWNRLFPLQALGVSSDHHGQSVPRSVHPAGLCLSAAPHPARFSEAGPIPMPSSVCQQPGVPMTYTKFPCLTHIRNCQHFSTKEGNFSHGLGSLFIRHICSRANTGEGSKKTCLQSSARLSLLPLANSACLKTARKG